MALIRHIAGIPTATEQRCVRCCEVIRDNPEDYVGVRMAWWPGHTAFTGEGKGSSAVDCTPHDPHAIDDLKEELAAALALERAR
jgi:hypothetical protein